MLLLFLTFISGVLTVLAPCVLPLLPVILGGSFTGDNKDRKRPYIIIGSLIASIMLFTVLLKASTLLIDVDQKVWTGISGAIVALLGLLTLFPHAWDYAIGRLGLQAKSQALLGKGFKNNSKWIGPAIIGLALGPVFNSCSPFYSKIIADILSNKGYAKGLVSMVVYCFGLGLILLLIAIKGQSLLSKLKWASDPKGWFRRAMGLLFILLGIAIITGFDKKAEAWLVENNPISITKLEQKLFDSSKSTKKAGVKKVEENTDKSLLENSELLNASELGKAPELTGLQEWINSDPLTLASLKGKVVLIDFWTYSCINCVRTLPYVEGWYEKYKDSGFVVIGVHAPEFAFEKVRTNVEDAVKFRKLTYPVALDNDYGTWNAYNNQYWPAHYLIDRDGNIRRTHFGEGKYDETEQAIQLLLGQKPTAKNTEKPLPTGPQSPETYLGVARAKGYTGTPLITQGSTDYRISETIPLNSWSINGKWDIESEKATSNSGQSTLRYHFTAKDVYLVFSGQIGQEQIKTRLVNSNTAVNTPDVQDGVIKYHGPGIYHIVGNSETIDSTVELNIPDGISAHAFTFGS